jgi:putative oxidoreductase
MNTAKTVGLWVITVLCSLMFLFAGAVKFVDAAKASEQFAQLGYPDWFRILIAVLEIAGAIVLLIPRLAWVGSGVLGVIMVGAVVSLVHVGAYTEAPVPAVVFVVLLVITYVRWPHSVSKTT